MKYYKVVRVVKGKLMSVFNTDLSVEYKVGEFVEPVFIETPLLVFNNLSDAINFKDSWCRKDGQIYECEVLNPRKPLSYRNDVYLPESYNERPTMLKKWWRDIFDLKKRKKASQIGYNFPPNSISCDAVKLIKKAPYVSSRITSD